jgi:hypothetical protein
MATLFRDYFHLASNRRGKSPLAGVQRRLPNLESASSSFSVFLTRRMESEQTAEAILQDGANSDARIQGFHYSDS